LSTSTLRTPEEIVAWFGAVQAQDYPAARWAIGQRGRALSDESVQHAVNSGQILRTHVLRPTWHLVTSADIRWMLELTAPRVKPASAAQFRLASVDARTVSKSERVIARALEGGRHRTRQELRAILADAGITASPLTMGHLLLQAELDAVVCSGACRGNQITYALFDERVPNGPRLAREDALAELARRYVRSHGPATAADFAWWSGLTLRDARAGIGLVTPPLVSESIGGLEYWSADDAAPPARSSKAHVLPNFDEYTVAYRDRGVIVDPPGAMTSMEVLSPVILLDGRIAGTWKRASTPEGVSLEVRPFRKLSRDEHGLVARAAERYGRFLGVRVALSRSAG
jgi:hypothetical protein